MRRTHDPRVARAVGARIKDARLHIGYTQQETADRTGGVVVPATIAKYETGLHCPSVEVLLAIAEALHVDAGHLLPCPAEVTAQTGGAE